MLSTLDLIINFLESFLTLFFVQLCMKSKNKFRYIYMLIFATILFLLVTYYNINGFEGINQVSLDLICTVVIFVFAMLISKTKSVMNCLFLSILSSIVLVFSITITFLIYESFKFLNIINTANFLSLHFAIISRIVFFIFIIIFSKLISFDFESKTYNLWYANISLLLLIFLNEVLITIPLYYEKLRIVAFVALCILVILAFFIYLMFWKSSKDQADKFRLELINNEYKAKENNYYQVEQAVKEISKLKHDMKHILLSIKEYNKIHDCESINSEIDTYISKVNNTKQLINTGNSSLDYIINQNIQLIKNKDIDLVCNYCDTYPPINQTDFYIIAGNLIENAVEHCESNPIKKLTIDIGIRSGNYYLKIFNSINKSVLKVNPKLYTTKKDWMHHGIGIDSVRVLVEKYDGTLEFYEEEQFFYSVVLLPIVEEV